jgi:hypothetical protein
MRSHNNLLLETPVYALLFLSQCLHSYTTLITTAGVAYFKNENAEQNH